MNVPPVTNENSPWWAKLGERFGVTAVMLAVVLAMVFRVAGWAEQKIVSPFIDAHLEQMATLEDSLKRNVEAIERSATAMEAQTAILRSIRETAAANTEILKENQELMMDEFNKPAEEQKD